MQVDDIGVFIGIDVGKSEHWATALDRDGRRIHDRALPSDESRLRDLYKHLAEHGRVLVVVDQPATIGALAVAVAQDMGVTVGYLPGLSMRRIADLSPGNAKTDARDAAVIAQAARTMPHTLRAISTSDEDTAALGVLTGLDLDLARQVNQTANRIRGLYTQIHPALETVLGSLLEHDAILEAIAARRRPHRTEESRQGTYRCPAEEARSPAPCRPGQRDCLGPGEADRHRRRHRRSRHSAAPPGSPAHLPALSEGRAPRPGPGPWRAAPPSPAQSPPPVPGIGVPAAAVLLAETLGRTFDTGAQPASYAGLAPVTRRSGSPIRGERRLPRRQ